MNKKLKINIVLIVTAWLFVYWQTLALNHIQYKMSNYFWQALLSFAAILVSIFGIMVARHWGNFKSGVGQGTIFISLGLLMWGIGQAGWTYYVIKDPANQTPPTHILDYIYFSSIPLWTIGILRLSKATGARYGLRGVVPKVGVGILIAVMFAISYYFLVVLARGGNSYFSSDTVQNIIFDLGYAAGDAVNLTLALAIFGLSWKYLGGKFKQPVLLVLFGFAFIYLADFLFSFYDGRGEYFNGHWTDLLYLAMIAIFGVGLCQLDPTSSKLVPVAVQTGTETPDTLPKAKAETPIAVPPNPANPPQQNPEATAENTDTTSPPRPPEEAIQMASSEQANATEPPGIATTTTPTPSNIAPEQSVTKEEQT